MKPRKLVPILEQELTKPHKRLIFLWGPRQVGKSTILNHLHVKFGGAYFNFDDLEDQRLFVPELSKLQSAINFKKNQPDKNYVFIDEVQKYPQSTQALKLLVDNTEQIILATGSSELRAKTQEFDTLAGRYVEHILCPLTVDELAAFTDDVSQLITKQPSFAESQHLRRFLDELMIYGGYPGVQLAVDKIEELKNITQNSIVKDIVNIYELKNTDLVYNLLRMLAMQVGNLVNVTELASSLGSTKVTVDNYLSILIKNRIIFFLEPLRINKRRGYLERKKIYFHDLGVRNTLVEDFRPLHLRPELGSLFENLILSGVWRQVNYSKSQEKLYYYREIGGGQKEIDLVIEKPDGERLGFEIKFGGGEAHKLPGLGIQTYRVVDKQTAVEFLV